MGKRIITRVGDVFCAEIDGEYKSYFQYIEKDIAQLTSSVIRVFKTRYPMDYEPVIEDIVADEILFYAHAVLRVGIEDNVWYKVGKSKNLGLDGLNQVLWGTMSRFTHYYENGFPKIKEVNPLENWTIWYVNCDRVNIGRLPEKYYDIIEYGSVSPYSSIIERLKYGYYKSYGLEFDIIKRRPIPGVNSYLHREVEGVEMYFHFVGEDISRQLVVTDKGMIRITAEQPSCQGYTFVAKKFWEINWKYDEHITSEEFETVWNKKQ